MTAVAYQLRGHSLVDGALGTRVDQKGEVGVAVDIDEARRDDQPLGVDLVLAPECLTECASIISTLSPAIPTSADAAEDCLRTVHDRAAPV